MKSARTAGSSRTRLATAVTLSLTLGALSLSCAGGGDPFDPRVEVPSENTYMHATATLIDRNAAAVEYISCRGEVPFEAGDSWELFGDIAAGGVMEPSSIWPASGPPLGGGSPVKMKLTLTDTTLLAGVSLQIAYDQSDPTGATIIDGCSDAVQVQGTFVNLDIECDTFGQIGPLSRFQLKNTPCDPALTWVNITEWPTDATSGGLEPAVPGQGLAFSPSGILAGDFSFVGIVDRTLPAGNTLISEILVEGCFRLNIPRIQQTLPVEAGIAPCAS